VASDVTSCHHSDSELEVTPGRVKVYKRLKPRPPNSEPSSTHNTFPFPHAAHILMHHDPTSDSSRDFQVTVAQLNSPSFSTPRSPNSEPSTPESSPFVDHLPAHLLLETNPVLDPRRLFTSEHPTQEPQRRETPPPSFTQLREANASQYNVVAHRSSEVLWSF
jgi:hypothetical protein